MIILRILRKFQESTKTLNMENLVRNKDLSKIWSKNCKKLFDNFRNKSKDMSTYDAHSSEQQERQSQESDRTDEESKEEEESS